MKNDRIRKISIPVTDEQDDYTWQQIDRHTLVFNYTRSKKGESEE